MSLLYNDLASSDVEQATYTPRVRIILKSSLQWRLWIAQVETMAQSLDVWRYIGPTTPRERQVNPPPKPERPNRDDDKYAKDPESGRLTEDARTDYEYDRDDYNYDIAEYRTVRLSLYKVSESIMDTLALELQALTVEERDTRELLRMLRERFLVEQIRSIIPLGHNKNQVIITSLVGSCFWLTIAFS